MTSHPDDTQFPRLRPLDFRPVLQESGPAILLRDPLQLSDELVAIPQRLGRVLAVCDGMHDREGMRTALIEQFQLLVGRSVLDQIIEACDRAYLLDNRRSREAYVRRLVEYQEAPYRSPALAGHSYPAQPKRLAALLDGYLAGVNSSAAGAALDGAGRGLLSPHIDYERGGPIYAAVWKAAAETVREADLAIILGTDHYSQGNLLTLTRQHYATPYGVLPTSRPVVDALAEAIGEDEAFAGELHHRNEHSIELAAVWLHHMRGGEAIETVPILCGGYGHFVAGAAELKRDPTVNAVVGVLRDTIGERRAIVVAAGDLSHVGPAFGGEPQGEAERARLRSADETLMARMVAGDAEGFFQAIQQVEDCNNVCGLPPVYMALRTLDPAQGERVAYDCCKADEQGTSIVSVGGLIWK